jgi:hypothetical protein
MTTQDTTRGSVVEEPIYQNSPETMSRITWRPADGPLAGQTLVKGTPATHPQAGRGVKFYRHGNEAAFKKAGVKANEVFARVEGKPELAALVAEYDRRQAAREAVARQKREAEDAADRELVRGMEARESELVRQIPVGHVRVTVTEKGRDSDGDRVWAYEAGGVPLAWDTPGMGLVGVASAIRPGALNPFAVRPVYSISLHDLEQERVRQEAKRQADDSARRARQEASAERRRSAFEEARRTGHPAVIRQWAEQVDDPENENSLDIVYEMALPDGRTRIDRLPTH